MLLGSLVYMLLGSLVYMLLGSLVYMLLGSLVYMLLGSLVYMLQNYLTFQSFLLFEKRVIYTKMMSTYLLHCLGIVHFKHE
jgi:hypothetical protein